MSATEFQAMMSATSVSGTGERELKKHLGAHLGKGFCPTRDSWDSSDDDKQLPEQLQPTSASGKRSVFLQERRQMWKTNERGLTFWMEAS